MRIPEETTTLVFDVGPLTGAEIEVRTSIGWGLYDVMRSAMREVEGETEDEAAERLGKLIGLFVDEALIGWNLDDHAGPIPPSLEGVERLPPRLLGEIIGTYIGAVGRVPAPLARPSPAGGPATGTDRPAMKRRSSTAGSSTGASRRARSTKRTRTG